MYLKNQIDAFWDELERRLQKCVQNEKKDLDIRYVKNLTKLYIMYLISLCKYEAQKNRGIFPVNFDNISE